MSKTAKPADPPRCPYCGETRLIEPVLTFAAGKPVRGEYICLVCARTWKVKGEEQQP